MSVKKLELPAYDPRGIQGMGLQYATTNRGGCHVRGYMISPEILGVPEKLDPLSLEGKAAWAKLFQDLASVIDALGTDGFPRLRLGIGPLPAGAEAREFVLSRFKPAEIPVADEMVSAAVQAAEYCLAEGSQAAMNRFNAWMDSPPTQ